MIDLKADTEKILKDHDAIIDYSDEFVGVDGKIYHLPEMGGWGLTWSRGTITLSFDSEERCRFEAAVFIHLFERDVDVCTARQMAYLFVKDHYETQRHLQELWKST